jgi:GNAT superfamily N-acetyltransferase
VTPTITLRPLAASDSLEALTALLHRAYAHLGEMGLNYTAVDQSVQTTRARIASGQCLVLEANGTLAGTVVVSAGCDAQTQPGMRHTPWFLRHDIAHLHQLAVEPALQGQRLGDRLVAACESWAREQGCRAIALDTAEPASHLRQRYARLGYRDVDTVQWPGKRYRSVVMVRLLVGELPAINDVEHRIALVRALWAHVQARDWAAMRASFADDAVTQWPVTGERFNDADTIVRVNAEYPEGWSIHVIAIDALVDGRVHSVVRVDHGEQSFFANSRFTFDGARITALEEWWATREKPPAWRNAEFLASPRKAKS